MLKLVINLERERPNLVTKEPIEGVFDVIKNEDNEISVMPIDSTPSRPHIQTDEKIDIILTDNDKIPDCSEVEAFVPHDVTRNVSSKPCKSSPSTIRKCFSKF